MQSKYSILVKMADIHTHLDGPNARPSPDIQDALRMGGDWRQIQLASQADLNQFVHNIESITLFLWRVSKMVARGGDAITSSLGYT